MGCRKVSYTWLKINASPNPHAKTPSYVHGYTLSITMLFEFSAASLTYHTWNLHPYTLMPTLMITALWGPGTQLFIYILKKFYLTEFNLNIKWKLGFCVPFNCQGHTGTGPGHLPLVGVEHTQRYLSSTWRNMTIKSVMLISYTRYLFEPGLRLNMECLKNAQ